ncbi:MAG: hypothetical protein Q9174_002195 [Haloplaca sp. 1 TL-2023]
MLGSDGEDDEAILDTAAGWFNQAAATADSDALLIHCSDTHLRPIENTRFFVDNGNKITTGQQGSACGGNLRGFQYGDAATKIIVLCSDSSNGAMNAYRAATLNSWNQGGDLRRAAGPSAPSGQGLNFIAAYLSYMVLHELMHAADSRQFPAELPDSGRSEA